MFLARLTSAKSGSPAMILLSIMALISSFKLVSLSSPLSSPAATELLLMDFEWALVEYSKELDGRKELEDSCLFLLLKLAMISASVRDSKQSGRRAGLKGFCLLLLLLLLLFLVLLLLFAMILAFSATARLPKILWCRGS